jgi:hypothetical protein
VLKYSFPLYILIKNLCVIPLCASKHCVFSCKFSRLKNVYLFSQRILKLHTLVMFGIHICMMLITNVPVGLLFVQ